MLHAHRALFGHLPGFELSHSFFPAGGDVFWTPADWAWIGGLMDALVPSLYLGRPIVAGPRGRFDPELAARVIVETGVRNAFIPPTALRLMKGAGVSLPAGTLRTVMSGGESLGADTLAWARESLGVTVAEIYGQTEANYLVGNSPGVWEVRPGSMGLPYPGHDVAVIDADGTELPAGETGEIAVRVPDPVAFLEYLNAPEATAAKFVGPWLRTGDLASRDADGYLWFKGRADDLIISAGYRISPLEVEQCLLRHPAVVAAAVVGVPDELRGQVVKAFVIARDAAPPRRARRRAQAVRPHPPRRVRVPARARVRPRAAADGDGEDPPPRARRRLSDRSPGGSARVRRPEVAQQHDDERGAGERDDRGDRQDRAERVDERDPGLRCDRLREGARGHGRDEVVARGGPARASSASTRSCAGRAPRGRRCRSRSRPAGTCCSCRTPCPTARARRRRPRSRRAPGS